MKKNYLKLLSSFLLAALFIIGCQKETKESSEKNSTVNAAKKVIKNSCRMTVLDWATIAKWEFHYNDQGLADEWIIDYGFGFPLHTNEMTYDNNGRLMRSDEFYFGSNYVYQFYYTGNRLSRLARTNVDNPADVLDFVYTYNRKGQNTRQDDVANDVHVLMTYDHIGNCTRTDLYLGEGLSYLTFIHLIWAARNPRLAIPGVIIGFPFYGTAGVSDKWWFTSNRTEIYDNGNLFLFNDYDPTQTTMITGNHNYPSSATYYDRITEAPITITFDYENCNGKGSTTIAGNSKIKLNPGTKSSIKNPRPLLRMGSAKSIKEQLQRMKLQFQK